MVVSIERADYKGDYVINLRFSDGVERNIDFSSFLQSAKNPMTRKYLDKELFKRNVFSNMGFTRREDINALKHLYKTMEV